VTSSQGLTNIAGVPIVVEQGQVYTESGIVGMAVLEMNCSLAVCTTLSYQGKVS
jgi:hypothetical protein